MNSNIIKPMKALETISVDPRLTLLYQKTLHSHGRKQDLGPPNKTSFMAPGLGLTLVGLGFKVQDLASLQIICPPNPLIGPEEYLELK